MSPPGTGKTYMLIKYVQILAKLIVDKKSGDGIFLTCQTNNACIEAYKCLKKLHVPLQTS